MSAQPAKQREEETLVAAALSQFAKALRAAGIVVGTERLSACRAALEWIDVADPEQWHAAARAVLVGRREDQALFDRVFAEFWHGRLPSRGNKGMRAPRAPREQFEASQTLVSLMAQKARPSDPERELPDRSWTATVQEVVRTKDFAELTWEEHAELRRAMERLRLQFAVRVTRRMRAAKRGRRLRMRRMLRQAARHSGRVGKLQWQRPEVKPRPLLVLADISGSMEIYSRVLLQFFHALGQLRANVEIFVFATRLTRVTAELSLRSVDEALDEVSRTVLDFGGGTRIGECLRTFNDRWSGRCLRRGAVLVVVSDGCETGQVTTLAREMVRLTRKVHRSIWLNPRIGDPRYQPRVRGMAAALAHVDDFLPCHNMSSLESLLRHLERLRRGRGAS